MLSKSTLEEVKRCLGKINPFNSKPSLIYNFGGCSPVGRIKGCLGCPTEPLDYGFHCHRSQTVPVSLWDLVILATRMEAFLSCDVDILEKKGKGTIHGGKLIGLIQFENFHFLIIFNLNLLVLILQLAFIILCWKSIAFIKWNNEIWNKYINIYIHFCIRLDFLAAINLNKLLIG